MASLTGTVKWFASEKGFGFIVPEGGGKDVFVHSSDLTRSGISDGLAEGERLTFDTEPGRNGKGPKAVNIGKV